MKNLSRSIPEQTIGIDVGEKISHYVVLDQEGEVTEKGRVRTKSSILAEHFLAMAKSRVVLENGSHSRWICALLEKMGHEVIVANTHKVRLIYQSSNKTDRLDAEKLARLGRLDVTLLSPIRYRSQKAHADLAVLRARDNLVRSRTQLINSVRGLLKPFGVSLPASSTPSFTKKVQGQIPAVLQTAVSGLLETIAQITQGIREYDKKIEELCTKYRETDLLRQVVGVGPLTSLAFVLTIEDVGRFTRSRQVGAYLGMVPKNDQSGDSAPQLRITKAGNHYLRRLLVGSAQYILGHYGVDCDLRRYGNRLAQVGGKRGKKRAVVAVARKLAVLLHHLWQNGEEYDPFYQQQALAEAVAV